MHGANNPKLCWRVNVDGTKAIIEACKLNGVNYLVYTSSAGVTYTGGNIVDVDERLPLVNESNAYDTYNLTKAEAEKLVLAANGEDGLKTVALRPSGIFGFVDDYIMSKLNANWYTAPVTDRISRDWQMSFVVVKPCGRLGITLISGIGLMSET
jgi:sterol-4alpha-carboxylate 3-dehydrogenase (decarboxylating)